MWHEGRKVVCLVYVDPRTEEGRPDKEYVARLDNGVKDAVAKGAPATYFDKYVKPFLAEGMLKS